MKNTDMSWLKDIGAFLELDGILKGFDVTRRQKSLLLKLQSRSDVVIHAHPRDRGQWRQRIMFVEKVIAQYVAGHPLAFTVCDKEAMGRAKSYYRMSIGIYLNVGYPAYQQYVIYKDGSKVARPSVDHFETLVAQGRLVDSDCSLLSFKEMNPFCPAIESCIDEYIAGLDLTELRERKKWRLKDLEHLYDPGRRNESVLLGLPDERIVGNLGKSENEYAAKRLEVLKMYERCVIVRMLSFGRIVSRHSIFDIA